MVVSAVVMTERMDANLEMYLLFVFSIASNCVAFLVPLSKRCWCFGDRKRPSLQLSFKSRTVHRTGLERVRKRQDGQDEQYLDHGVKHSALVVVRSRNNW